MELIPSHWDVLRVKNVCTINDEVLPESTDPHELIEYLDISGVDSNGEILEIQKFTFSDAPSRARRILNENDIIISTVRTYLKTIAFVDKKSCHLIASTGYAVIRVNNRNDFRFIKYILMSDGFISTIIQSSKGANYPAITPTELAKLKLPVPPLPEQKAIANYLDSQIEKITHFIQKKEQLIELLKEQRQGIINEKFIKGNSWTFSRIKYISRRVGDGLHGTPVYADNTDFKFVNGNNLKDGQIIYNENTKSVDISEFKKYNLNLSKGSILYSINGTIGNSAIYNGEYIVLGKSAAYIEPLGYEGDCDFQYLFYFLKTDFVMKYFLESTASTTIKNLSLETLRNTPLHYPKSKTQQRDLIYRLKKELNKIDETVAQAEREIELIKEYKEAMIAEAVLGKLIING